MIILSEDALRRRQAFFDALFDDQSGFLCLARKGQVWEEKFIQWPSEREHAMDVIAAWTSSSNVYFCATLLERPERQKLNVLPAKTLWADLDNCPPDELRLKPTLTIETSPGRYQALWRLSEDTAPLDIEDLNKRIAYAHRDKGADVSGWDLTQMLRVPYTYNHKYRTSQRPEPPSVSIIDVQPIEYNLEEIRLAYPQLKGIDREDIPFPELPDEDGLSILDRFRFELTPGVHARFNNAPEHDWSRAMWQLMLGCFEAGMSREEVFIVARDSECNKYKRDQRSEIYLWKDVIRAWRHHEETFAVVSGPPSVTLESLLTDKERQEAESTKTFVEEYIEWASTIGDAASQYHTAGGFILLSALLAGRVRLPTSFGVVIPNLWFMILADTTLTRKSTAMDLAMDLLTDVDSDAILATDGSIEGLFASLATRPGRPSVFLRDEFSGLLEAISKKDYLAGMAETLTKLYDGKFQKKILRRETIEVRDPVLILFAGGIRDRVLGLMTHEHVASGFVPRFIFITAESDAAKVKPLGPPTERSTGARESVRRTMEDLFAHYQQDQHVHVRGRTITVPKRWDATLTPDAWLWYNRVEHQMMQSALRSPQPDMMTPTFDRLCKSGLKGAVLLAASERPENVVVDVRHLCKAFLYVERWREYTLEVLNNIGRTAQENTLRRVLKTIRTHETMLRSELMQVHHLDAKSTDAVLMTLEQRGMINRHKQGRTEVLAITSGGRNG